MASYPDPPNHLSPGAKREWHRLAPEVHARGHLIRIFRAAFEMYCSVLSEWADAEEQFVELMAELPPGVEPGPGTKAYLLRNTARRLAHEAARDGREFFIEPTGALLARASEPLPTDDN